MRESPCYSSFSRGHSLAGRAAALKGIGINISYNNRTFVEDQVGEENKGLLGSWVVPPQKRERERELHNDLDEFLLHLDIRHALLSFFLS